jgi:hypothetical protein
VFIAHAYERLLCPMITELVGYGVQLLFKDATSTFPDRITAIIFCSILTVNISIYRLLTVDPSFTSFSDSPRNHSIRRNPSVVHNSGNDSLRSLYPDSAKLVNLSSRTA